MSQMRFFTYLRRSGSSRFLLHDVRELRTEVHFVQWCCPLRPVQRMFMTPTEPRSERPSCFRLHLSRACVSHHHHPPTSLSPLLGLQCIASSSRPLCFISFSVARMFFRTSLSRCAAPASLTRWLVQLAERAEQVASATPPEQDVSRLWADIEKASEQASVLRETDTLMAITQHLLRRRLYPSDTTQWPVLAKQLLASSDVESRSVLTYPGVPDALLRTGTASSSFAISGNATTQPLVPVSREMLLLAGGVVPLSARSDAADGAMLSLFLNQFVQAWQARNEVSGGAEMADRKVLFQMCQSLIFVMRRNAMSLEHDRIAAAVHRFCGLLLESDVAYASSCGELARVDARTVALDEDKGLPDGYAATPLCRTFLWHMQNSLSAATMSVQARALGPRLALSWLGHVLAEHTGSSLGAGSWQRQSTLADSVSQRLVHDLVGMIEESSTALYVRLMDVSQIPKTWRLPALLRTLQQDLEVMYQQNINSGNPLSITEEAQSRLVTTITLVQLRAMRLECRAPDAFLRDAVPIVERMPASMLVEAELLFAKIALLDLFDACDEGRDAVYDDLVRSLRNVVELRPRAESGSYDRSPEEPFGDSNSLGSGAGEYDLERRASSVSGSATLSSNTGADVTGCAQAVLQRAHVAVLTALCDAHQQARVDQGYELVISHKYHGLIVTSELILPLMKVMSRRGDCRVFNLVDLCVLYCQCPVDIDAITYLFQACAVAGDHYRARTLYLLLQEVIPGFALKVTPSIRESLRELKIEPPPPLHAFMTESQRLAKLATLGTDTEAVEPSTLPGPERK